MRDVLHWLPYQQRIVYRISALVRRCIEGLAPSYLRNFVAPLFYSASYLITLFCQGGVAGPPNADCYPTAPSLLCGWSDGLEWSTGCAASDASSPLGSFSL